MKTFKFLVLFIFAGLFSTVISSCSDCSDEDPRARIVNNGTEKASVQIKTSGGNTVNINNVDPNTASTYSSYAPGQVTFTITVKNKPYETTFDMNPCYEYDISIDANNVITVKTINRN